MERPKLTTILNKLTKAVAPRPLDQEKVVSLRTSTPPARPDPGQIAKFADDGYIVLHGFLDKVGEFNAMIEAIVRAHVDQPVFMRYGDWSSLKDLGCNYEDFATKSSALRIPNIHELSAELRGLVASYHFEEYLAAFLSDTPRVDWLQSLYFPFSSTQGSHSDKFLVSPPSFPYRRETLFGVWLALDNASQENGALFGWAGSHKVTEKPLLENYTQYGDYARDLAVNLANNGLQPHFVYAEAGDVILWASDFVHGGALPLSDNVTRRALVLHYGALLEN